MSASFVYVMTSDFGVKVGFSNNPAGRLSGVIGKEKRPVHLFFTGGCDRAEAEAVEKLAHLRLRASRIRGEWFSVEPEIAVETIVRSAALLGCRLAISDVASLVRKRRGPAPTGKGLPVMVRLQPDQLAAVDAWIAAQPLDAKGKPISRPEAIRALAALGLERDA